MDNPLGTSSIFYTEHTVEKWREALGAGFTEVELSVSSALIEKHDNLQKYFNEAENQYKIIREAGLNISSFHLPFGKNFDISDLNEESAKRIIEMHKNILAWMAKKQIRMAILHGSAEPINRDERKSKLEKSKNSISILSECANKKGINVAVEILPRTCLGNCADELLDLIDNGKKAKICLDVNHLLLESHRDFIRKTKSNIITTHFSDYDGLDEKHWVPGEGIINWKELVELLKDSGYTGRFVFELQGIAKSSPKLNRNFSPAELLASFRNACEK